MYKIIYLLALTVPSCITGSAPYFSLQKPIDAGNLQRLNQLAQKNPDMDRLEERIYSVPLLPLFCGYRTVDQAKNEKGERIFKADDLDGFLFTLIYGDNEEAVYLASTGQHQSFSQSRGVLLGLLWNAFQESKKISPAEETFVQGWSIAWGLIKSQTSYEQRNGKPNEQYRFQFLWIPIIQAGLSSEKQ